MVWPDDEPPSPIYPLTTPEGAISTAVTMDPLSAAASVMGIITATAHVVSFLKPYATAVTDAPSIAAQLHSEVLAIRTILQALQKLITKISGDFGGSISGMRYASLIQVDELKAVLTDGVMLFSNLESMVNSLPPHNITGQGTRMLTSIQWARKKGALVSVFTRLQAFKTSINCILSILQR